MSQEATDRAETREGFELGRVASCRSREHRWRTKLDFSSGEAFDDNHRPTTLGAAPEIARVVGAGLGLVGLRSCSCPEQLKAMRQVRSTLPRGQQAGHPDADEPFQKQMQLQTTK